MPPLIVICKTALLVSLIVLISYSAVGQQQADPGAYEVIEVQPEFPGGISAFFSFLARNIRYPKSASRIMYMGKVIVKFVVEEDGSLTFHSADQSYMSFPTDLKKPLTEEQKRTAIKDIELAVINTIKAMPKWKPGTQNGKAVNVLYTLPFNFNLE